MKILFAILPLVFSSALYAQSAQPQTEQQAVMLEWASATVSQLMCVVHYEKTEQPEKAQVYAGGPLAHGASHGIPPQYVAQVVFDVLPQIRAQWDQMAPERAAAVPEMCDSNFDEIKTLVDSYIEYLDELEKEQSDPVMIPKDSII